MLTHHLNTRLLGCSVLLILFLGCKKTDSTSNNNSSNNGATEVPIITPVGAPAGSPVSKSIGAAGGSLVSADGRVEVHIPSGALSSATNISIRPVTNTCPGGVGLSYDLLPNGTKFIKPATIVFHYSNDDAPDNFAWFLFVAYQDSTGAWQGDQEQRDFDTVAKTVSLDISHFTIYTAAAEIRVITDRTRVQAGQTANLAVKKVRMTSHGDPNVGPIVEEQNIPANLQTGWKVNGVPNGNSNDGTISAAGDHVIYQAPATIDKKRTVNVSITLMIPKTVYKKKVKIVELKQVERSIDIALDPADWKYHVGVYIIDSAVSSLYGYVSKLPVYTDSASFDLHIFVKNGTLQSEATNFSNAAPAVTPPSAAVGPITYSWPPGPVGEMNIYGVTLVDQEMPPDSILHFTLSHKDTQVPGLIVQGPGGTTSTPPSPMIPQGSGIPQAIDLDLKRQGPFIFKKPIASLAYTYVAYIPL